MPVTIYHQLKIQPQSLLFKIVLELIILSPLWYENPLFFVLLVFLNLNLSKTNYKYYVTPKT